MSDPYADLIQIQSPEEPNPYSGFAPVTLKDRAKAVATGVNQGAVNLAGMPVDTILNLADLAKAGYGTVGRAFGMSPESMPNLTNRGNIPMSSEWLTNQIAGAGAGGAIQNPNPEDYFSKLLHSGGQAAVPIMFGGGGTGGAAATARNVGVGAAGNAAGQMMDEAGLPPLASLLASMAVPAAATGASGMAQRSQNRLAASKINNEVRDQSIREAQKAGYVIPPMNVHPESPGGTNRVISAVGGKVPLEQEASIKNVQVTDNLARKYVGLRPDEPITPDNLARIRNEAGQAYDVVKSIPQIQADPQYIRDIVAIKNQYLKGASGNRTLASKDAEMAIADASKPAVSGDQVVYLVRKLREAGFKNLKAEDPVKNTTGEVQRGLSKAMDDLIARHLQQSGTPSQYRDYITARETIAKAHTIEDALNEATGHVNAGKLAQEWQKGAPLSGEGLQIAKAASVVPQGTQQVTSANPGLGSVVGWGTVGTAGALGTGNPAWLAAQLVPGLRIAARKTALSNPYQRMLASPPNYKPGVTSRLLSDLFPEDMTGLAGMYAVPPKY